MTIFYRKNFSSGTMSLLLKAAPDYADDPRYDEIAVEEGHTLPDSDDATLTQQFRLVIWDGNYTNPGDDPSMEIVTAVRTTHPLVYQIVTRGEEDTAIVAHSVGCNVGLHYTAGVSLADLETIQAIIDATAGSIIYTKRDVWGNKSIGILDPGQYGKVLVTQGDNSSPYWDWIWGTPGGVGGQITRSLIVNVGYLVEDESSVEFKLLSPSQSTFFTYDPTDFTVTIAATKSKDTFDPTGSGADPDEILKEPVMSTEKDVGETNPPDENSVGVSKVVDTFDPTGSGADPDEVVAEPNMTTVLETSVV